MALSSKFRGSGTGATSQEADLTAKLIMGLLKVSANEQFRQLRAKLEDKDLLEVAQQLEERCRTDEVLAAKLQAEYALVGQMEEELEASDDISRDKLVDYVRRQGEQRPDLQLPTDEGELANVSDRMFKLVQLNTRCDTLDHDQFATLRQYCLAKNKSVRARANPESQGGGKYCVLPDAKGEYAFAGSHSVGYAEKLLAQMRQHKRSVEDEFKGPLATADHQQDSAGRQRYIHFWNAYKYVRGKSESGKDAAWADRLRYDARGDVVVRDKFHHGWSLKKFVDEAHKLGVTKISQVEVAILRLYTDVMHRPWNNALRGLGYDGQPDAGQGLRDWATCLLVLCGALLKLSRAEPKVLTACKHILASHPCPLPAQLVHTCP